MVQIVENWVDVRGEVVAVRPGEQAGFDVVTLRLAEVVPVPSYPALVKGAPGVLLDVLVPAEIVSARRIAVGVRLKGRVRRAAPDRVFAHREQIDVEP